MKKYIKSLLAMSLVILFALPGAAVTMDDINIHGFISQGYFYTTNDVQYVLRDSDKGSFEFNEMAINFSVNPDDNLSLGLQLAAFDLGELGNDEVHVDWAYGRYSFNEYLGVQAGIMKIPFGLYNEVRKIDMVRSSIMLPSGVYPEWFREVLARMKGAGFYGTLPGNISYQAMYGHVDVSKDGGVAYGMETLLDDLGMKTTATSSEDAYAGMIQWDSPFGLKLVASHCALGEVDLEMSRDVQLPPAITGSITLTTPMEGRINFEPVKTYVLSAEYMRNRLTLAAEYAEFDLEFTADIELDSFVRTGLSAQGINIPAQLTNKTTMQGYYGSIAYQLLDNLEVGTYYSEQYFDKDDRDGKNFPTKYNKPDYNGWLKDLCLSARYDFSVNWSGKIEAHLMDGTLFSLNEASKDWELYAAKLTYSF